MLVMHEVIHEQKSAKSSAKRSKASGYNGAKEEFVRRSMGRISQAIMSRKHEMGRKTLRRRNGTVGKRSKVCEECKRTGGVPKWRERERSLLLKGEVTRTAGSGILKS